MPTIVLALYTLLISNVNWALAGFEGLDIALDTIRAYMRWATLGRSYKGDWGMTPIKGTRFIVDLSSKSFEIRGERPMLVPSFQKFVGDVSDALTFTDTALMVKRLREIGRQNNIYYYHHTHQMVFVWKCWQVMLEGFSYSVANPIKRGKYLSRLFSNADFVSHQVDGTRIHLIDHKTDGATYNDGGGWVSRQYIRYAFPSQWRDIHHVYFTVASKRGMLKGLARVVDDMPQEYDFILPSDWKGVKVESSFIALTKGHTKRMPSLDIQSLINLRSFFAPFIKSWINASFEAIQEQMNGKKLPLYLNGPWLAPWIRMYARSLVRGIINNVDVSIPLNGYVTYMASDPTLPSGSARLDEKTLTLWVSATDIAKLLKVLGGGDLDDNILVFAMKQGNRTTLLCWRQPNAYGEVVLLNSTTTPSLGEDVSPYFDPLAMFVKNICQQWDKPRRSFIDLKASPEIPASLEKEQISKEEKMEIAKVVSVVNMSPALGTVVNHLMSIQAVYGRIGINVMLEEFVDAINKGEGVPLIEIRYSQSGKAVKKPAYMWWLIDVKSKFKADGKQLPTVLDGRISGIVTNPNEQNWLNVLYNYVENKVDQFQGWVERNIIPYAIPPEIALSAPPASGALNRLWNSVVKEFRNDPELIMPEFRKRFAELGMGWVELAQNVLYGLKNSHFSDGESWLALQDTKVFASPFWRLAEWAGANPLSDGNHIAVDLGFVAYNRALAHGMTQVNPSNIKGLGDKDKSLYSQAKKHFISGAYPEYITFSGDYVTIDGVNVGRIWKCPDALVGKEGRIIRAAYNPERDVLRVIIDTNTSKCRAIVPEGFWDEAYQTVEDAKAEIDWYITTDRAISPLVNMLYTPQIEVFNKVATVYCGGSVMTFKGRSNADALAKAQAFFEE